MEAGIVEVKGLSIPPCHFACYKNFITGLVKVKVNSLESMMKSSKDFPTKKLKLTLNQENMEESKLELEDRKHTNHSPSTIIDLALIEKVVLQPINDNIKEQKQNEIKNT